MKRSFYALLILGCLAIAVVINSSCRHVLPFSTGSGTNTGGGSDSTITPCDSTKIYFQQQVLPILVSYCGQSNCHDNASHREGVILISYSSVMQTGGVNAGNASRSKLYEVIADGSMPPNGSASLSAQQKNLIYQWIQQGALDLVCAGLCDSAVFTYGGAIQPLIANKCQGCHNSTNPQGNIDLTNYNSVKTLADNGKLLGSVEWAAGYIAMPQGGNKLSDCELAQIQKWIANGSPNN